MGYACTVSNATVNAISCWLKELLLTAGLFGAVNIDHGSLRGELCRLRGDMNYLTLPRARRGKFSVPKFPGIFGFGFIG